MAGYLLCLRSPAPHRGGEVVGQGGAGSTQEMAQFVAQGVERPGSPPAPVCPWLGWRWEGGGGSQMAGAFAEGGIGFE